MYPSNLFTLLFLSCFSVSAAQLLHGDLSITVTDKRSHLPIPGVRVCLLPDTTCLTSDSSGRVEFDGLRPGRYDATVTAQGFEGASEPNVIIHQGFNAPVLIEITKETILDLGGVTVTSHRLSQMKPTQSTSTTHLSNFELSNTPGTANDITRVLSFHPGVVSSVGSQFDNSLYVRGGQSLENVYVIDGLELDNANHFSDIAQSGGAIGFINGSLVQDLDFYTGGFPADLPPRLSSVIDMKLRSGSLTGRSAECDLNMTGLGMTLEGPIVSGSSSYLANCRFLDMDLLQPMLKLKGVPRLGDGTVKLHFKLNDQQTLSILALGAIDNYKEDSNDWGFPTKYEQWIYQGGAVASWKWGTDAFENNLSISGSLRTEERHDEAKNPADLVSDTYKINVSEWNRNARYVDSLILPDDTLYMEQGAYAGTRLQGTDDRRKQITAKEQFTLYVRENDQLGLGCDVSDIRYRIGRDHAWSGSSYYLFRDETGEMNSKLIQDWDAYDVDSSLDVKHGGAYLEYIYHQDRIKAVASVRGDYYTVLTDYGISPRLGLRFDLNPVGVFSLSGALCYQFPAEFSSLLQDILAVNPNSPFQVPLDMAKLERNRQGVLGFERQFGANHLLSVETYYKWYDREYPFINPDARQYVENSGSQRILRLINPNGKKKSYGLEIQFQKKNFDRFYYSFSYSLFNVMNKYVNGNWYNDENNLRNSLGLIVGSNFLKNQGVSLRVNAYEGRPYSPIRSLGPEMGYEYDTTKGYYSERLPAVVSAGLRYSFTFERKWGSIIGYLEVINLLNQDQIIERWFDPQIGYRDLKGPGIVPILGLTVKF